MSWRPVHTAAQDPRLLRGPSGHCHSRPTGIGTAAQDRRLHSLGAHACYPQAARQCLLGSDQRLGAPVAPSTAQRRATQAPTHLR